MGVVYKALDTTNGSSVALKSLPRADPSALYRFKQEFRSLADISHPNLATLYELFAIDDGWWLAMEFVDGLDFIGYVRGYDRDQQPPPSMSPSSSDDEETSDSSVPLSSHGAGSTVVESSTSDLTLDAAQIDRLRSSVAQLASALDALHANDTLHRDIKPSNVLVDRSGRTVLLDFGLATAIAETRPGDGDAQILGTVPYMAPEQASSAALTPAADWYAVGVMLYQALAGQLPFSGTPQDVIHEKQTKPAPALQSVNPGVPADLAGLCADLLEREPDRRPAGRDVLARLGVSEVVERGRDELFLGRETQLDELRGVLAIVRRGTPAAAFVHGRSGAGKTHLIRQFLTEVQRIPDAVVLEGRCYEDESVPYKAVDSLIDSLARFLKRLPASDRAIVSPRDSSALTKVFPVLRQVKELVSTQRTDTDVPDQQEVRRRAFRGLRELLGRIGDRRPLVLYVDDLQWGDADSAALLGELLRPPDPPILLLICSYRSEYAEKSVCVKALRQSYAAGDVHADEVRVEPLETGEAIELARALLPAGTRDVDARAAAIAHESSGIPFFIQELARHFDEDVLAISGETFDLDELIRRRVANLPPPAKSILEVVAVCGHPITRQALANAAGAVGDERGALRLLRTGNFVRTTGAGEGDWVEPYHDRIREAVSSRLPAMSLRDHHRRIAGSLEAAGNFDAETIAVHFEGGELLDRAGHYYGLAADTAADILAFEHASSLYTKALDLQTLSADAARQLRIKLADALANDGRGPDAARNYLTAAAGAEAKLAVDLQRRAAYQYCVSGHLDQGHATLKNLLGSINIPVPESRGVSIARFLLQRGRNQLRGFRFTKHTADQIAPAELLKNDLIWAASAGLSMFDVLQGAEFQSRNLYHALSIGEPHRIARALAWEAAHTSNTGAPAWPRTSRLLSEARMIAQSSGHPHSIGMAQLSSGIAEFTMGRWSSACTELEKAEEIFRSQCTGVAWELDTGHAFELWGRIYAGDFNNMSRRTASLLKEGVDRGDKNAVTTLGTFMVPHVRLVADDAAGAEEAVHKYLALWGMDGYHLQHLTGLMSLAYIDLYRGDGQSALDRLRARQRWFAFGFYNTIQVLRVFNHSLLARGALMAARGSANRAALLSRAKRWAGKLEREGVNWITPLAQTLRAGVADLEGRKDEAIDLLAAAADAFDAVPMEGYAAAARWRAASIARSSRGDELKKRAEVWMNREGIRNPDRMTDMLAFGIAS